MNEHGGTRRFCFDHYPIAKRMYQGALSLVEPNPFGQISIIEDGRLSFNPELEDL